MDVTDESDTQATQPVPLVLPNSKLEVDGLCRNIETRVELNGNESPILWIEDGNIFLTKPIAHFYDGSWEGKFIIEVQEPEVEVVYTQTFDVWITSLANLMPAFEGVRSNETLLSWEVHKEWIDVYQLPEIEDPNVFDVVNISVEFTAATSDSLKNCNCFTIDQESRQIKVELPTDYST